MHSKLTPLYHSRKLWINSKWKGSPDANSLSSRPIIMPWIPLPIPWILRALHLYNFQDPSLRLQLEAPSLFSSGSKFCAPSTNPTILYRFEKNVFQSFSTPFSLSSRSNHSGDTSAADVEVLARAREASWPANTEGRESILVDGWACDDGWKAREVPWYAPPGRYALFPVTS